MALKTRSSNLSLILESTQGKTYTVILVTILVIALLLFVAALPAYLSITNQLVRNEAKTKYLGDLDTKLEHLKELSEQEKSYTEEIDILNSLFKEKRNDEFIIANISKLAEKNNCKLFNLGFSETEVPSISELGGFSLFSAVPVTITLNGDLVNLEKFLKDLENFPATITVKSVNYSKDSDNVAAPNAFNMVINAEYYFWNYES